jgi:hypothetical protein
VTYANREGTYWARCKNTSGGYENSYVRCSTNALRLAPKMTYGSWGNGNATDVKNSCGDFENSCGDHAKCAMAVTKTLFRGKVENARKAQPEMHESTYFRWDLLY